MSLMPLNFKFMIDNLPTNILVCDKKSFVVTYANKTSKETLNSLASLLPKGVSGDNIVGQCIDIFHKKPEYQRSLLSKPENFPHKAVISLGKEFLELQVVDVPGGFGSDDSMMLTWTVVTARERLKRMIDKMPINIMMADPETFDIIFMNETSLNTLRSIEKDLPVKADKVIGSNIDIFHKHPEHQRKMLANPKNLPHRAKIQVGPEWLELNVAAIVDNNGAYIGPMVSWSVITDRVKVADNVQQIANTVASASTQLHHNSEEMGEFVLTASQKASEASGAAASTSSTVQSVASAAEEMNASINEIASNMSKSRMAVDEVIKNANNADRSAQCLESAAESMVKIIELIQSIAGQINLLALNATIESARAGEAGKGFSVVASEVKELATQTTKATEEITKEIHNMQNVSKEVVTALGDIKKSVEQVGNYVIGVANAVEEQTAVTKEISSNMHKASSGVETVSNNAIGIAESTKQASDSTKQVQAASGMLSEQAERLNAEIKMLLK